MSTPRFRDVIRALHGHAPYEWQERAAAELSQNGWWPSLRAPTGAGKTSLIDCWLYALALAGPDRLGRRLVWVVDRRAVVDQVYAYADQTVAALTATDAPPPLAELADALRAIGGGSVPRAVLWRGGSTTSRRSRCATHSTRQRSRSWSQRSISSALVCCFAVTAWARVACAPRRAARARHGSGVGRGAHR